MIIERIRFLSGQSDFFKVQKSYTDIPRIVSDILHIPQSWNDKEIDWFIGGLPKEIPLDLDFKP